MSATPQNPFGAREAQRRSDWDCGFVAGQYEAHALAGSARRAGRRAALLEAAEKAEAKPENVRPRDWGVVASWLRALVAQQEW